MSMPRKWMIENYEEFGGLIKDWLDGKKDLPRTIDELQRQADDVGAEIDIPDNYLKLEVIVRDTSTLTLVLPAPEFVRQTEEKISAGGGYDIPGFYGYLSYSYTTSAEGSAPSDAISAGYEMPEGGIPPITIKYPPATPAQQMRFMAARIADYTVGQCG